MNNGYKYIVSLDEQTQRKVIYRLLDFYYNNRKEINETIDVFIFETLQNKLYDLNDTIEIGDLL